jgi:hypothetical protein
MSRVMFALNGASLEKLANVARIVCDGKYWTFFEHGDPEPEAPAAAPAPAAPAAGVDVAALVDAALRARGVIQ